MIGTGKLWGRIICAVLTVAALSVVFHRLNAEELIKALRNMRWVILIFMPLFPAIIGTAVWWKRRA